jgi:uncharacterized RDD family membrane protein YckC
MLPENRAFLIRGDDGQDYGPVDLRELREWVQENRAGLGTIVCLDELGATWHPWQTYPELVALVAEVQGTASMPPPPPPPPGTVGTALWRRILAWVTDVMLMSILFIPIMSIVKLFLPMDVIIQTMMSPTLLQDATPQTLHDVTMFELIANACLVFYLAGFYALHGRTPAMTILGMRVVDQVGQRPTLSKSILRALTLVLSVNLLFPLVYVFFNPQRRAFHDFIAGTYVVNA